MRLPDGPDAVAQPLRNATVTPSPPSLGLAGAKGLDAAVAREVRADRRAQRAGAVAVDDERGVTARQQALVEEAIDGGDRLVDALAAHVDRRVDRARVALPPAGTPSTSTTAVALGLVGLGARARARAPRRRAARWESIRTSAIGTSRAHRRRADLDLAGSGIRRRGDLAAAEPRHDHRRADDERLEGRGRSRRQLAPRLVARDLRRPARRAAGRRACASSAVSSAACAWRAAPCGPLRSRGARPRRPAAPRRAPTRAASRSARLPGRAQRACAARSASAASSSASNAARSSSSRRRWSATFASRSSTFAPARPISSRARSTIGRAMPMRCRDRERTRAPRHAEVQLERRLESLEIEADRGVGEPRVGTRRAP